MSGQDQKQLVKKQNPIEGIVKTTASAIEPFNPGLIIVLATSPLALVPTRAIIERQMQVVGSKLGVPMPHVSEICALHAGHPRALDIALALEVAEKPENVKVKKTYVSKGTRKTYNFLSSEGADALEATIKKSEGKAVTLSQDFGDTISGEHLNALSRIHYAAQEADVILFFIAGCTQSYTATKLDEFYELIEVSACEPDPRCTLSLSFKVAGLNSLHAYGVGHMMCNIRYEGGKIERQWRPFVSESLRDRLMWMMRGQGASLSEIGKAVGLDKSNVKHHLDKLPSPQKLDLKGGWIDKYVEALGLEVPETSGAEA